MRESELYRTFANIEKNIKNLSQRKKNEENEVISLRLQVNALIRIIKIFFPIKWLFSFYYDLEFKKYRREMVQRYKEMMKMQKEMKKQKESKIKEEKDKIGRNALCSCGSGKKFKKCCLNKVTNKENKNEQSKMVKG